MSEPICKKCGLSISPKSLAQGQDLTLHRPGRCPHCGGPIPTASQRASQAVRLDWIEEELDEGVHEASYEGSISEWQVVRRDGQRFRFNFLMAMRKWIAEKRITAGDQLYTASGSCYAIEDYPGVADLFTTAERKAASKYKQKIWRVRWQHLKKRRLEWLLLTLLLILGAVGYVQIWRQHQQQEQAVRRAASYLQGLQTLPAANFSHDGLALQLGVWQSQITEVEATLMQLQQLLRQPQYNPSHLCWLTEAHLQVALLLGDLRRLQIAQDLLQYQQQHKHVASCYLRAQAMHDWVVSHPHSATRHLSSYLQQNQTDAFAWYLQAQLQDEANNTADALAALQKAYALQPHLFFAQALSRQWLDMQQPTPAIELWLQRIQSNPLEKDNYKQLGAIYLEQQNEAAAMALYEQAIQRLADAESFYLALLQILDRQRQWQVAALWLRRYKQRYPHGRLTEAMTAMAQQLTQNEASVIAAEKAARSNRLGTSGTTRRRMWEHSESN